MLHRYISTEQRRCRLAKLSACFDAVSQRMLETDKAESNEFNPTTAADNILIWNYQLTTSESVLGLAIYVDDDISYVYNCSTDSIKVASVHSFDFAAFATIVVTSIARWGNKRLLRYFTYVDFWCPLLIGRFYPFTVSFQRSNFVSLFCSQTCRYRNMNVYTSLLWLICVYVLESGYRISASAVVTVTMHQQ